MPTLRMYVFVCVGAACLFALSGCAKVKLFGDEASPSLTRPQVELREIAGQLEETPWPEPRRESLTASIASILLGGRQDAAPQEDAERGMTRQAAAFAYLDKKVSADREQADIRLAVMADARASIATAAELIVVADTVAATPTARYLNEDVSVLEKAITELRGQRSMFEAIFQEMERRGVGLEPIVRDDILSAFSGAASDIGAAADRLLQVSRDRVEVS
ncbi:MAG: hypothetical protein AAGL49_09235 [Pseudomonadota bacterium]